LSEGIQLLIVLRQISILNTIAKYPLIASQNITDIPNFKFFVLVTLVAPGFFDPIERALNLNIFPKTSANKMLPSKYAIKQQTNSMRSTLKAIIIF
jgi:hypothetical protein